MASVGTSTKQYYSLINFLDQREILDNIVDIQNDEGLSEIFTPNRYFVTKQETFHHFVNESLFKIFDTTSQTVTGTGTATITATSTTATAGYARKGCKVFFPSGGAVGFITGLSSAGGKDTIIIQSADGSNITSAAGDLLSIAGVSVGEASVNPTNVRFGLTKYFNRVEKFREVNDITDIQACSTVEVKFQGKNYIVYKDLWEKITLLKGSINASLFAGKQSATGFGDTTPTTPSDPYNGMPVSFTRGLYDYITTYGQSTTVATPGTFAYVADTATLVGKLLAAKAPKNLFWWNGTKASLVMDASLKALGSSGVNSVRLIVDGMELNTMVDQWKSGGFTFEKSTMGILDSQELFANTVFPKYAYLVPKDKVKVEGGDGYRPRISVRYFKSQLAGKSNMGNDIIGEWHTGALAPTGATNDTEGWRTNWSSTQGLEVLAAAQTVKMIITA